jgi:STAS domain
VLPCSAFLQANMTRPAQSRAPLARNTARCAGMHTLQEAATSLLEDGVRLVLANPSRKVQAAMSRAAVVKTVGSEWVFVRTADAVAACVAEAKLASPGKMSSSDITDDLALPAPPPPMV